MTRRGYDGMQSQRNSREWMYHLGVIAGAALLLILLGGLMVVSTTGAVERLWRLFDPEAREIARRELAATSAARIATAKALLWLGVAVRIGLALGAAAGVGLALATLWRRSRAYYARAGLFPVVEIEPGVFYDPNRAGGEDVEVTAHALEVQRHQAMAAAGPFPALPPAQPQAPLRSQIEPGLVEVVEAAPLDDSAQSGLLPGPLARAIDGQWREVADASL